MKSKHTMLRAILAVAVLGGVDAAGQSGGPKASPTPRIGVSTKQSALALPTPAQIPGLLLWLRADKVVAKSAFFDSCPGNRVYRWPDQSGNHKDFVQDVCSKRPVFVPGAVNGHPILRFDGANTWLTHKGTDIGSCRTMVAMARSRNTRDQTSVPATLPDGTHRRYNPPGTLIGNQTFWVFSELGFAGHAGGRIRYRYTADSVVPNQTFNADSVSTVGNNPRMIALTHDAGTVADGHTSKIKMYRDGIQIPTNPPAALGKTSPVLQITCIGGGYEPLIPLSEQQGSNAYKHATDLFCGDVGEIIIYNRVLSASDIHSLHSYMHSYWGVP